MVKFCCVIQGGYKNRNFPIFAAYAAEKIILNETLAILI
jgi:hypothetical protein